MASEAIQAETRQPEAVGRAPTEEATATNGAAAVDNADKNIDKKSVEKDTNDKPEAVADSSKPTSGMLKTKGQINYKDIKANNKFDASVLPETDDPAKIRAQVEFYLSDSNLPTDKYMWNLVDGEENKPVKLKTICAFKRMRRFTPYEAVVAALRDSTFLSVSGPEGDEEIQRKKPYSADRNRERGMASSVYVKGFGDEQPSTQFEIEAWFTNYGPVNSVRLRRTNELLFKGSVFVEFQNEEIAKDFIALDPKPQWQGHELKIMSKKAYIDEKNELIKAGTGGRGRGGRDHKGRDGERVDRDDWKKRRDQDQKNGHRDRDGGHFRGRGRGGRGNRGGYRGRDQRGPRDEPREPSGNGIEKPVIQSTTPKKEAEADKAAKTTEVKAEAGAAVNAKEAAGKEADAVATSGKRAREEGNDGDERPAKKIEVGTKA